MFMNPWVGKAQANLEGELHVAPLLGGNRVSVVRCCFQPCYVQITSIALCYVLEIRRWLTL